MITRLNRQRAIELFDTVYDVLRLPLNKVEDEGKRKEAMLRDLMAGSLHIWVAADDGGKVTTVAATRIVQDDYDSERALRIVSLWGFQKATPELWEEGFAALNSFAMSQGCAKIVAETNVKRVEQLAIDLGFTRTALIEVEVK